MFHKIKEHIVIRLYHATAFRKGHLLEENILRGLSRSQWGYARKVLRTLVDMDIVQIYNRTKYGTAYQLNINRLDRIEEIIENAQK